VPGFVVANHARQHAVADNKTEDRKQPINTPKILTNGCEAADTGHAWEESNYGGKQMYDITRGIPFGAVAGRNPRIPMNRSTTRNNNASDLAIPRVFGSSGAR
jgi:hypothetical protein